MKKIFFLFFCFFFISSTAFATIDRTHIYFTNNSAKTIVVTPSLQTTDASFKHGSNWQGETTTLMPYQTKEIIWFMRNVGVKLNQTYLFQLQAAGEGLTHALYFNFNLVAKTVYGSTVDAAWQIADGAAAPTVWLSDNKINRVQFEEGTIYAKAWRPSVHLFDNYKIVLNQKPAVLMVPTSQEHIRIITYNTQMMPSVAGAVDHLNQPKTRVKDIPLTVKNADVVVMQELFDPGLRETMLEIMSREYPYNTLVVGDDSSKMLTGGVMIFSRWPIEVEDQIVFKAGSGMDDLAAKGVSYARINKNGFVFHVFGTHLQSGSDDAKTREQQLVEMRNFMLAKNIPTTQPVFLAGDFNIMQGSHEEDNLNSVLNVQDVKNIGYPYSVDALTNGMSTSSDRAKIDYIFAQKDHRQPVLAYANIWINRALADEQMWPEFELSDHYPVTGDFYF